MKNSNEWDLNIKRFFFFSVFWCDTPRDRYEHETKLQNKQSGSMKTLGEIQDFDSRYIPGKN